jgi:hypothetical protein
VQVGREALITLTQGSLRDPGSIHALEGAAAELYKALQAGRDRGELGGSTLNSVVTYLQTWLLQWSVWRSIEHTMLSSANGCMSTHALCLQLRCARIHSALQFFTVSKTFLQSTLLLGDSNGLSNPGGRSRPEIKSHKALESHLAHYSGLILYMKEMDELTYGKLCAVRVS